MERILAEETADGVAYVILHEEDEDRNGQDQEQRKLAEPMSDIAKQTSVMMTRIKKRFQ